MNFSGTVCYKGGAKQQDPPPPSPIQKTADATEAADILTRDRKRLRNSFLDSTIAGEGIGGSGSGGNQFLG